MTREEYDRVQRVNWSTLKELGRSPVHYRHRLLTPRTDTDAMKLGRAVHVAVLEPEHFFSQYVLWDEGIRRGKVWDAFKKKYAGSEILKRDEYDLCLAIQAAVRSHPDAAPLLHHGEPESTMLWTDAATGLECKGRVDYGQPATITDLKTTRDASQDGFGREAWRLDYQAQLAMYQDGWAESHAGVRPDVMIVAVENYAPHVVQVYRVADAVLEAGREHYRGLLETLKECRTSGQWPGYATGVMDLMPPRWAMESDEEDLTGLGIEIAQAS